MTSTNTHQIVGLPSSDITFASAIMGKVNKTISLLTSFTRMGSSHSFYVTNYTAGNFIDDVTPRLYFT